MNGNYILKQADAHLAGNAADIVAGENIADFRVVPDESRIYWRGRLIL